MSTEEPLVMINGSLLASIRQELALAKSSLTLE